MPRNVVATSKERTMQTSRPYNLPKTKKQMTTRIKIHLENLLHAAATNSKAWKVSCTVQQSFQFVGKPPARCSNISKRLESLPQPCGKVSNDWTFRCSKVSDFSIYKFTPILFFLTLKIILSCKF